MPSTKKHHTRVIDRCIRIGSKKSQFNLQIDKDVADTVLTIAKVNNISKGELVNEIMKDFVASYQREHQETE